jgi:hypothetical protein
LKEGNKAPLKNYRDSLVKAYKDQSEAYDKTTISLSGGALAVSMTFIHNLVHSPSKDTFWLLGLAWGFFSLSILATLVSMLTSQWAIGKAISQVDEGHSDERAGGWFGRFTVTLNVIAGAAFIAGVSFLVWFALANMPLIGEKP